MSSYIYISSLDQRFTVDGGNSFDIELNSSDTYNMDNAVFSIDSVIFPNLQYPVNRYNNVVVFQENGVAVDLTAVIPEGSYTTNSFCSALKAALEVAGAETFTCSVSLTSNKLTIASTGTFKLTGGTALLRVMGFNAGSAFVASATGGFPINIGGTNFVDVVIGNFTTKSTKSGRNIGEVFARIAVNKPFGSVINWTNPTDDDIQIAGSLGNLNFQLFDEVSNPYELPDNAYVSIVLKLKY